MRNFSIDSPEYAVAKGLCKPDSEIGTNNSNVKTSDTWPVYNKVSNQVAPNCKDMLLFCEYGAIEFNCMERFKTILTDDGLCCMGIPCFSNFYVFKKIISFNNRYFQRCASKIP